MKRRKRALIKVFSQLELPEELIGGVPVIRIIGDVKCIVENHKGIIKCDQTQVCFKTEVGSLRINGKNMTVNEFTKDDAVITGTIISAEYCT